MKYFLDIGKIKRVAIVGFDPYLESVDILTKINEEQIRWFWSWMAFEENEFLTKVKRTPKVVAYQVQDDLSFERFWTEYAYKVGKKDRCERLWNLMNDAEKTACLASIKRYNFWLTTKTIDKAFPSTFLAQKRWENDFKI